MKHGLGRQKRFFSFLRKNVTQILALRIYFLKNNKQFSSFLSFFFIWRCCFFSNYRMFSRHFFFTQKNKQKMAPKKYLPPRYSYSAAARHHYLINQQGINTSHSQEKNTIKSRVPGPRPTTYRMGVITRFSGSIINDSIFALRKDGTPQRGPT